MDKNRSEIFGQFLYEDSITYDDLMMLEEELVDAIKQILAEAGAQHLDFTPSGDMLCFQCALEEHDLGQYRLLAKKIAAILPPGIRGRLICLDKWFVPDSTFYYFWLKRGEWKEARRSLPENPPDGLRQWSVSPLAKS